MLLECINEALVRRHAGHHHHASTRRYGYLVFMVSVLNVIGIWAVNWLGNRYKFNGFLKRSPFGKSVLRLASLPLYVQVLMWAGFLFLVCFFPMIPKLGSLSVSIWADFARRLGKIAFALVPFNIFLATKPSPLPETYYLSLLPLHKWVSRLLILFSLLHTVGFIAKWIYEQRIDKLFKWQNLLGLVVFILYAIVAVVSIQPIRRKFYSFFYSIHTISAWLSISLIFLHSRFQVNFFSWVSWMLILYSSIMRVVYSKKVKFQLKTLDASGLVLVTFPTSSLKYRKLSKLPEDQAPLHLFSPGSHIRVSPPLNNWKAWVYPSHPFTIASLSTDSDIKLVMKKTSFRVNDFTEYCVSLPYPAVSDNFFRNATDVVIVCGGSGISFGLPIYKYFVSKKRLLLAQELDSRTGAADLNVQLIWIIRNTNDLFILKELGILSEDGTEIVDPFFKNLHIFLTKLEEYNESFKTDPHAHTSNTAFDNTTSTLKAVYSKVLGRMGKSTSNYRQIIDGDNQAEQQDFELDTLNSPAPPASKVSTFAFGSKNSPITDDDINFEIGLSDEESGSNTRVNEGSSIAIPETPKEDFVHNGRPDLAECFDNLLASNGDDDFGSTRSKWVVGCGPDGLIQDCAKWTKNNDVGLISEVYAM